MIEPNIEDYILNELSADDRDIALDFINYLKDNYLTFYKDNCECWKNKIYYWVKWRQMRLLYRDKRSR